jgi:hypothetical protein
VGEKWGYAGDLGEENTHTEKRRERKTERRIKEKRKDC